MCGFALNYHEDLYKLTGITEILTSDLFMRVDEQTSGTIILMNKKLLDNRDGQALNLIS